MLRKTACFFLKIAYASRLMTLCVLPIEEVIEKLNEDYRKNFQKNQKIFQKPLDKSKICAIIKLQRKETNKKCLVISEVNKERTVRWTTKFEADGVGKVPQGRGERKKERRVRKAMIPSQDEAIA